MAFDNTGLEQWQKNELSYLGKPVTRDSDATVHHRHHKTDTVHENSAGVAGLTTALLLSKNGNYSITVAAKHMPGDYDIEYASPWAGADYLPCDEPFLRFLLACSLEYGHR